MAQEEGRRHHQLLPRAILVGRSSLYITKVYISLLFIRIGREGVFLFILFLLCVHALNTVFSYAKFS